MPEDKPADFAGFWPKIKELTKDLPKEQQDFLSAMFWLAWLATAEEEALEREFEESFTPEQASLLVDYHSGGKSVHMVPRFIRSHFIRSHFIR
jgi:phosphoserine phosphatase